VQDKSDFLLGLSTDKWELFTKKICLFPWKITISLGVTVPFPRRKEHLLGIRASSMDKQLYSLGKRASSIERRTKGRLLSEDGVFIRRAPIWGGGGVGKQKMVGTKHQTFY
jgi:hypothetical protein